ncbi:MAG: hypothetical protein GY953_53340, partial [bacterium]|nr:hypothetical protein [bacterium]
REARVRVQAQRAEFLQKQKREEREKREQEPAKLRDDTMSRIRAAEQEANAADPDAPEGREVVDWWEDERPKNKVSGTLERVDCRRGAGALAVKTYGGEEVRLTITDPSRIVILGGGEETLGCGPQSPPRNVSVEYFIDADEKNKTAGEVVAVDFR